MSVRKVNRRTTIRFWKWKVKPKVKLNICTCQGPSSTNDSLRLCIVRAFHVDSLKRANEEPRTKCILAKGQSNWSSWHPNILIWNCRQVYFCANIATRWANAGKPWTQKEIWTSIIFARFVCLDRVLTRKL